MIISHGTFDLADKTEPEVFAAAFRQYSEDLRDQVFVTGWQFAERSPVPGYDDKPPSTNFTILMYFQDRDTAERCYS